MSAGRDIRLGTGCVLLVFNAFLLVLDAANGEVVTWQDVALHTGLLITSLLLIDPRRTVELVSAAKKKLPLARKVL